MSHHPPPLSHLVWTPRFALWLAVPGEVFGKVTQDKMAILPSALELDLGAGETLGWSQPLVGSGNGRREGRAGPLGTGLKYSKQLVSQEVEKGCEWEDLAECKGNLGCC